MLVPWMDDEGVFVEWHFMSAVEIPSGVTRPGEILSTKILA
jgi:hypothetical protein